jgi:hypothetical protein
MTGVFVRFQLGADFDDKTLRKIAETARTKFEGLPGLRSKAFTLDIARRQATNFYVWESEAHAKAFFSGELIDRVSSLYGARPSIEFVDIAALVDNVRV